MTQAPNSVASRLPLGELLVQEGRISSAELRAALSYREERGVKIGQALVALHLVSESDLARALRSQGAVRCMHLTSGIVDLDVAHRLPAAVAREFGALAVQRIAGRVTVAMEDPSESYDVDALSVALGEPVWPVHAEPERIRACQEHVYGASEGTVPLRVGDVIESKPKALRSFELVREASVGHELEERASAVVQSALEEARRRGARTLMFEPTEEACEVRFEIDGRLESAARLPREWHAFIVDHLRSWAGIPPVSRSRPEQERALAVVAGEPIELEITSLATLFGTCVALRLATTAPLVRLSELAFEAEDRAHLERIAAGAGLVLVAGPRDSGRATLARALVAHAADAGRACATLERARCAEIEGVMQVQRDPEKSQAAHVSAMRALAREVVYVDAIDDDAALEALAAAALDGALVIARVPAVDAAAAVRTLVGRALGPQRAAEVMRAALAVRRVRTTCPACRTRSSSGASCARCANSRWSGRAALVEILDFDGPLAEPLARLDSASTLREAAHALGFPSLVERGEALVKAGATSARELVRAQIARGHAHE